MRNPSFVLSVVLMWASFVATSWAVQAPGASRSFHRISEDVTQHATSCQQQHPYRTPPVWLVRGGSDGSSTVHEPTSLEDVDAILIKAGAEGKLVVIDFSATWCGPCQAIAPLFKELSEAMNDVVFVKIDVDENPDTAAKYNVSAMPTFVFVKGGEVVDRLMGANAERLQELIDEHK